MTDLLQKYELELIEKKIGKVVMTVSFRVVDKETREDVVGELFVFVHQAEAVKRALNSAYLRGRQEGLESVMEKMR